MFIALLSADGVRCLCNTISRHLRQGRGHKPMPCVLSLIELPRGRLRQAWAFFNHGQSRAWISTLFSPKVGSSWAELWRTYYKGGVRGRELLVNVVFSCTHSES